MRLPRNKQIFRGQPDLGAYLGVFFLLLIFVMMNSFLVFTPGVPIRLPDAEELPGVAGETLVVAVDSSGQFYYDNQIASELVLRQKLMEAVNASREPLTLVIEADRGVTWDTLKGLMQLARKVGIRDVLPATRPVASGTNAAGAAVP